MIENEFEIISYPKLRHINIFLNHIYYRNFHMHNEFELLCVLDGAAEIRKRDERISCAPGCVVLLNSNEAHEIDAAGNPVTVLVLQVSNHFLRDYDPVIRNTIFERSDLFAFLTEGEQRELWEKIKKMAFDYVEETEPFRINCIAHTAELFSFLLGHVPNSVSSETEYLSKKRVTLRMNRIQAYIDANYKNPVRLQDVAALEQISTTHLSHFFSENFGITFQDYLNNIRFEHSVRLMNVSAMSLADIALSSGFSDPKYMTKMFLRRFGCKPAEFRAQLDHADHGQGRERPSKLPEYRYTQQESSALLKWYLK